MSIRRTIQVLFALVILSAPLAVPAHSQDKRQTRYNYSDRRVPIEVRLSKLRADCDPLIAKWNNPEVDLIYSRSIAKAANPSLTNKERNSELDGAVATCIGVGLNPFL